MKTKIVLTVLFIFVVFSGCKDSNNQYLKIERTGNYVKIPVSNVELADFKLDEYKYVNLISRLTSGKIEAYPIEYQDKNLVYTKIHPVIGALHYGFAHHRPVIISPDIIWLLILQGFSKHISYNPEILNSDIYSHSEIQKITIQRDDFIKRGTSNNWNEVFPAMTKQIKENINEDLYELMLPNFTTTTENISISYQITMMNALSGYYDFNVATACGIPYIILEGSEEDWKWIKKELPKLKKYNLDFWIDNLESIIDKIYESSTGEVDTGFWKSIYKWNEESGGSRVTGWIIKFFPYLETTDNSMRINQSLDVDYHYDNDTLAWKYGLKGSDFPSGMAVCDFTWQYFTEKLDMQFYAGFVGIKQMENLALKPEINWFVAEKQDDSISTAPDYRLYDWSVSRQLFANELDLITPCKENVSSKIYEFCTKPDSLPIFNPDINKTYEAGIYNFKKELTDSLKKAGIKGNLDFSILIYPSGSAGMGRMMENYPNYTIWEILTKMSDWKPAIKDGKIVITEIEMKIEI